MQGLLRGSLAYDTLAGVDQSHSDATGKLIFDGTFCAEWNAKSTHKGCDNFLDSLQCHWHKIATPDTLLIFFFLLFAGWLFHEDIVVLQKVDLLGIALAPDGIGLVPGRLYFKG